jgi:hypothetical protein
VPYNSLQIKDLAERGGFEPPVQLLTVQRFSKPPPSATRPPLRTLQTLENAVLEALFLGCVTNASVFITVRRDKIE